MGGWRQTPGLAPAGPAGLRRGGVVQELGDGAVGRSSGLRVAGTVGVAQVAVVLRGGGLWGRFVH